MDSPQLRVAIIGGGFSGAMTAVHLLRQNILAIKITIIEPRIDLGRGLAYSTPCEEHLLNVPAFGMSAFPEEPSHFLEYIQAKNKSLSKEAFVPRKMYGEYLSSLIKSELTAGLSAQECLEHILSEVVDITTSDTGYFLHTADKRSIGADCIVLALGNLSGGKPNWLIGIPLEHKAYMHNPWQPGAIENIASKENVLIVGTGLTAVDKIIQLERAKHRGAVFALSRHGLFPRVHFDRFQGRVEALATKSKSSLLALKTIRHQIATNASSPDGDTWRRVIDGLRPTTQEWWQSLPEKEQRVFLRHLSTLWDVHRHRMAPSIGSTIGELCSSGQLKLLAGKIALINEDGDELNIAFKERGKGDIISIKVNKIINCTGPQSSLKTVESLLLSNLLAGGLVAPHKLGTGIATRADGQVLDKLGNPIKGLFAIGPLLKAELLESVAVPELKQQAFDLATKIVKDFRTIVSPLR